MSRMLCYLRLLCGVAIALLSGCTLGPRQIHNGRLKYNEAIQQTFQEEMLLNLVRLKYREIPEFLSVGGIAAQYSFDGRAGAKLTLPNGGPSILGLDGAAARSERPTISYIPARGEEFQKGLLAPIDLQSLQLLARTGWSWDRILRTTVQYMNDVDNAISAGGPTPDKKPEFEEFHYLAQVLRQLQSQRVVELAMAEKEGSLRRVPLPRDQLDGDFVINSLKDGYKFKDTAEGLFLYKDEEYLALIVKPQAKHSREMQEVARMLGLRIEFDSPEPEVYEIESAKKGRIQAAHSDAPVPSGMRPRGVLERLPPPLESDRVNMQRRDIVVSTRSLLEVMFYLSQGIDIPLKHQMDGLVTLTVDETGAPFDWSEMLGDMFNVRSSKHCPKGAAVAIRYKGYWFYIDDRDLSSQSTFTLLVELFGIEVRAGGGGGFLYTLNVGG